MTNKKIIAISALLILASPLAFADLVLNKDLGINQKTIVLATPIPPTEPSPITITQPGCYKLIANITDKQIIIASDDVALFLNGFSINNPTLNADAVVINAGRSDIIIQGGEISGSNTFPVSGVLINDNCTNVLITGLKILTEATGISCTAVTESSNILIKENVITDCITGIGIDLTTNARIKQNFISAPNFSHPLFDTIGIAGSFNTGITIDYNHIVKVGIGIEMAFCTSSYISNCLVDDLPGVGLSRVGIRFDEGISNIIENCTVNNMTATAAGGPNTLQGIRLLNEHSSCIRQCLVNFIHPAAGITLAATGILIQRNNPATDFCIAQDNVVANIFGNSGFGYQLVDTTATPTSDNFINNKAIHCFSPIVPYSANIIDVVSGPQATEYPWNWIIP